MSRKLASGDFVVAGVQLASEVEQYLERAVVGSWFELILKCGVCVRGILIAYECT